MEIKMQNGRLPISRAALTLVCTVLSGCSYQYQPLGNTPGTLTLDAPGSLPRVVAPGSAASASQVTGSGPPASGTYRGEATALNDPGGFCSSGFAVTNWRVRGDHVDFGSFSGTIEPSGALTMQAGPTYVQGQFSGSHFV